MIIIQLYCTYAVYACIILAHESQILDIIALKIMSLEFRFLRRVQRDMRNPISYK